MGAIEEGGGVKGGVQGGWMGQENIGKNLVLFQKAVGSAELVQSPVSMFPLS